MKNINFKRNESVLKGLEIQTQGKKKGKVNWDRIIYFALLAVILIFFFRYLINEMFFIEGNGQVRFENISIRNTDDCRVIEIFVLEGDEVKIGDSLFSYIPDDENADNNNANSYGSAGFALNSKKQGDVSWSEREVFKVKEEIKVNNFLIAEKVKLKNLYSAELQRIRNEVMLDVLPRNKLDDQLAKINQLNFDIQSLRGKTSMLAASLNQLEGMKRDLSATTTYAGQGLGGGGDDSGQKVFYAPLSGVITTVMKNEFEVALKSEEIMSIHKPENISVRGFFQQEDLASLKIGDRVDLHFPDGSDGRGIIKRFYFATYRLPEEFQKKYEPTTRSLTVDIYPETKHDLKMWKAYWKMAVKITKTKY
jgi:multidrug resistance efflux pump